MRSEDKHPISRVLMRIYEPAVEWTLRHKWLVVGSAVALVIITIPVFLQLGSEFMPPLDEGAILYMPSTMPGISIAEAQRLLQITDRIIKQFPEVETVLGKAGRAETSTDPAPLSMLETVIILKPRSEWRPVHTWYSSWAPQWAKRIFRHITPDTISSEQLIAEMDRALKIPGVSNAWTMPIKGRIDMLTTGIRTPVGLKISGADLAEIEKIGTAHRAPVVFREPERAARSLSVPEVVTSSTSSGSGRNFARYGLSIEEAQKVGGERHWRRKCLHGGERAASVTPINVRYMRDFRSDREALGRVLVSAGGQRQVALSELADIRVSTGPSMIRNEDGLLTGYVYVDIAGRDVRELYRRSWAAVATRREASTRIQHLSGAASTKPCSGSSTASATSFQSLCC